VIDLMTSNFNQSYLYVISNFYTIFLVKLKVWLGNQNTSTSFYVRPCLCITASYVNIRKLWQ